MKHILFILTVLFLSSCTSDSVSAELLIVQLHLVNSDASAASGINVSVSSSDGSYEDALVHGITDENGNVQLVFPELEDKEYAVSFLENEVYLEHQITGLQHGDFSNYTFSPENYVLYKKAESVTLQIIPHSISEASILSVWVIGDVIPESVDWHPEPSITDDYYFRTRYTVLKNSNVTVHYLIQNLGTIQELTVNVSIPDSDITYNLDY
ncbi:putative periplasmic lipoprotein [Flavobacterium silvaticum]|uniref:Carboxypeptidase regulatory-like domain-containing protein n=1 Tax=Flavobacterium silvaticum TaxID=1852020 RepID=A0A972FN65_9FLAO|nr:hypothetical protein [Flavobacterium silvaticum]NMH29116.1 hypothetical protein [Flavobacterium silvaticum]